jgi:hypothetical protein
MRDLIDGERGDRLLWIGPCMVGKLILDLPDPLNQKFLGSRVQCGKRTYNPGLALRSNQLRSGHNEHRRTD